MRSVRRALFRCPEETHWHGFGMVDVWISSFLTDLPREYNLHTPLFCYVAVDALKMKHKAGLLLRILRHQAMLTQGPLKPPTIYSLSLGRNRGDLCDLICTGDIKLALD